MNPVRGAKLFFIALLTGFIASCAELPSPRISPQVDRAFSKCSVAIRFSGEPRKLRQDEVAQFESQLTGFPKWTPEGLVYEDYSTQESAVCMCASSELPKLYVKQIETSFKAGGTYRIRRTFSTPQFGDVIEAEMSTPPQGVEYISRFHSPKTNKACIFVQTVAYRMERKSSAEAFLESTHSSNLTDTETLKASEAMSLKGPPSQRLTELKKLLDQGLITKEEYDQKRKEILQKL